MPTLILSSKAISRNPYSGPANKKFIDFAIRSGMKIVVLDNTGGSVPKNLRPYLADPVTVAKLLGVTVQASPDDPKKFIGELVKVAKLTQHNQEIYKSFHPNFTAAAREVQEQEEAGERREYLGRFKFLSDVEKIFGNKEGRVRDYNESKAAGIVTFSVRDFEVDFEKLVEVSELLKTRKINLHDKSVNDGCETCGHGSYSDQPIHCFEVNFS